MQQDVLREKLIQVGLDTFSADTPVMQLAGFIGGCIRAFSLEPDDYGMMVDKLVGQLFLNKEQASVNQ